MIFNISELNYNASQPHHIKFVADRVHIPFNNMGCVKKKCKMQTSNLLSTIFFFFAFLMPIGKWIIGQSVVLSIFLHHFNNELLKCS